MHAVKTLIPKLGGLYRAIRASGVANLDDLLDTLEGCPSALIRSLKKLTR